MIRMPLIADEDATAGCDRLRVDDLLGKTKEDGDDDDGLKTLSKDDKEDGHREEILGHRCRSSALGGERTSQEGLGSLSQGGTVVI